MASPSSAWLVVSPAPAPGERVANLTARVEGQLAFKISLRFGSRLPRPFRNPRAVHQLANRNYEPRAYPGRMTLFRSKQFGEKSAGNQYLGWERVAGGGVELHEVPSTHLAITEEPYVRDLAAQLRTCLDRALAGTA